VEESFEAIAEALAENGKVIVTGCLGVKKEMLMARYPNLLAITGPQDYEAVMTAVHTHLPRPADPFTSLVPPQGLKLTPRHYAYLKISEGCNHKCTFCIIPSMRGKLMSRPVSDVLREAEQLAKAGVKELLVISQDTSAYGVDVKYQSHEWRGNLVKTRMTELVTAMAEFGIWVRLHYVYPYPHVDEVIPLMADGKLLPYLDVPFQHANPRILKLMKRPASGENNLARVQAWRNICPELTLRSTFIVGFPGETEAEFQELLDFLTAAQLDRVGCFKYSAVEGAQANALPDSVPEDVKQGRWERFMALQAGISAARLQRKVGQKIRVLVDSIEGDTAIARSTADAPEIDGKVLIRDATGLKAGDWANVQVESADDYDLYGVVASN
jgi:ribosomal protein S12 methylthiotransferase